MLTLPNRLVADILTKGSFSRDRWLQLTQVLSQSAPTCLAASLPLALFSTHGCSQSAPQLHPAQPARPCWLGCQELSSSSARALWLLPSPLWLPVICLSALVSQALACPAMWACGDGTSSDDDEHNTSNAFLLLSTESLIALTDGDELKVALGCRVALDVFTVAQQDYPLADQGSLICGPGPALWR